MSNGMRGFSNARISLTFWYCCFLLCILIAFSLALFTIENQNFTRIVLLRDFGKHLPQNLTLSEMRLIRLQVIELRKSFSFDLILIDFIVLVLGGGLSYFLAGKTLKSIEDTVEQQREFLANASHEFRTPLAAIQIACEVALRSENKTKEAYHKVIEQTYQESKRLGNIANDLLTLSRVESGIAEMNFSNCDLNMILSNALDEISPLLLQKKLHIKKHKSPVAVILGDPDRLKQLFLIILDNAIKYTPEHGIITVSLRSGSKKIVEIQDSGIGIAQSEQSKIFDRFYQSDPSRSGSGAGLGLSIAKWIADMHKATIDLKSEQNKGSLFIITFPGK